MDITSKRNLQDGHYLQLKGMYRTDITSEKSVQKCTVKLEQFQVTFGLLELLLCS